MFFITYFITLRNLVNTHLRCGCNFPNCFSISWIAQQSFLDRKKSIFEQCGKKSYSAQTSASVSTPQRLFFLSSALLHYSGSTLMEHIACWKTTVILNALNFTEFTLHFSKILHLSRVSWVGTVLWNSFLDLVPTLPSTPPPSTPTEDIICLALCFQHRHLENQLNPLSCQK